MQWFHRHPNILPPGAGGLVHLSFFRHLRPALPGCPK